MPSASEISFREDRAPSAFKRRNIFTSSVDFPLALRSGRPMKSAKEKRKTYAERQRRFRSAQRDELAVLRELARKRVGRVKANR